MTASSDAVDTVAAATRSVSQVKDDAERIAASSWVTGLARIGYATRGFLYVMVGLLALEVATGLGGEATGTKGAITSLTAMSQRPVVTVLLVLITLGLICYSLWGLVRATVRPKYERSTLSSVSRRLGYLVSCLWYGSLVPIAVGLLLGRGGQADSGQSQPRWADAVLNAPAGRWIVLAIGVIALGFAAWQAYEALSASFRRDFKGGEMSNNLYRWATLAGRAGYAARGIAYAIIGWLVIQGALHGDAGQMKGTEAALQTVQAQPHGAYLLGAMGVGLLAFGLYSLIFSRYAQARHL